MSLTDYQLKKSEANILINRYFPHLKIQPISNYIQGSIENRPIIFRVEDIFDLFKIHGFLKNHFSSEKVKILFRGQKKHHQFDQFPNLFRNITSDNILNQIMKKYDEIIKNNVSMFQLEKFEERFHFGFDTSLPIPNLFTLEPTLQHYSLPTVWLDLVEDLSIALFFAYNEKWEERETGFIFIHGVKCNNQIGKGLWDSNEYRIIDLKEASHPMALRPLMQNSFLLKNNNISRNFEKLVDSSDLTSQQKFETIKGYNYLDTLLMVIEIPQKLLSTHLNNNGLLNNTNLFPSETIQFYKNLVKIEENFSNIEEIINEFALPEEGKQQSEILFRLELFMEYIHNWGKLIEDDFDDKKILDKVGVKMRFNLDDIFGIKLTN